MHNPYKIPEKFPNVIKFLNRIADGGIPAKLNCTYIRVDDYAALVTKSKIYLLEPHNPRYATAISGCIANRFNIHAWDVLELMNRLYPAHRKEVTAFRTWLQAERQAIDTQNCIARLRSDAKALRFKLVEI